MLFRKSGIFAIAQFSKCICEMNFARFRSKSVEVVSTGLDCEQSRESAGAGLEEVTCKGDPRAEAGDKVPVIVNSQKKELGRCLNCDTASLPSETGSTPI
jgi:hypothetical protein